MKINPFEAGSRKYEFLLTLKSLLYITRFGLLYPLLKLFKKSLLPSIIDDDILKPFRILLV